MRALRRLNCSLGRFLPVLCLLLLMVATVNAYTIVMRSGRRIEIPSTFTLTSSTLTYEVSDGIQITLQMSAIDVQATERANNEVPGSFLQRIQLKPFVSQEQVSTSRASRSITNRDLEALKRRREQSELAYEARRKALGLPSVAETRQKAAIQEEFWREELREKRSTEMETEERWRARASVLRTEIAAVDAQLNYVRLRLEELQFSTPTPIVTSILPFGSFDSFGRFGHSGVSPLLRPNFGSRQGVFVGSGGTAPLTGRIGFGGRATRGQIVVNPGGFYSGRANPFRGSVFAWPGMPVLGSAIEPYDFNYDRNALITRFNELAETRVGLNARWKELEDEARRAGVPPGWLRP